MCTSCSSAANTHILPPLSSLASMLLFTETDHLSRTVYLLCINLFEQHATSSSHGAREEKRLPGICLSSLSQDLLFGNGELKGEVACWIQNDPHVTHSHSAKHISASNNLKTNLQGLSMLLHKERWPRWLWFHSFLGLNQAESQKQNACR